MPRYQIITKRALYNGFIIEADNEEDARNFKGTIIDEQETDSWADENVSFDQVEDDCDEVELP